MIIAPFVLPLERIAELPEPPMQPFNTETDLYFFAGARLKEIRLLVLAELPLSNIAQIFSHAPVELTVVKGPPIPSVCDALGLELPKKACSLHSGRFALPPVYVENVLRFYRGTALHAA
jgi:hypothetical protein